MEWFAYLRKKKVLSTSAMLDRHRSPQTKKNKSMKSPLKAFPASQNEHQKLWGSGRRMGILNVTTTPVSVKTPSSVQVSNSQEEKEGNMKDKDIEDAEEVDDVETVVPDNAVVPDVGLEEEIVDNESPDLPSHCASEPLQNQDNRTFYLVTPIPYSLSSKQTSKDATSGYGSMYSPLQSGPINRKRPRHAQSPINNLTLSEAHHSDESEIESLNARSQESQPIARQLFQTPASYGSLSRIEDSHNTRQMDGLYIKSFC
jgi:hypothetical protein